MINITLKELRVYTMFTMIVRVVFARNARVVNCKGGVGGIPRGELHRQA